MAVTSAITDLVKSVAELLSSVFGTAYTIVHSFLSGLIGLFAGFFAFIGDLTKGVFDVVGGVGRFIAGNIVILGILGAAGYAYVKFIQPQQQQQGSKPAAVNGGAQEKKTN
ncbi:hypothetical protein MFIFM68171_10063 [Madurella fahalii]|uniref:Uncharacterized protein n=1 Tax=Madurella fahalii TaxID=1157608 RepID=A0ABQ0GQ29_9PEZI